MTDAWVAPDSRPDDAVSRPGLGTRAGAEPRPTTVTGGAGRAVPAVPVPLRPMALPDLLDGSLRILKLAPAKVLGLAAVLAVPAELVVGVLTRQTVEDADFGQAFSDAVSGNGATESAGLHLDTLALGTVTQGLVLAGVAAGLATLVTAWYTGRDRTLGEVLALTGRRAFPLVVAWVLVHLAEAVFAIGLIVGALAPMTWFAVVSPIVACEGVGPVRALRRSAALTGRRFGAVLGTCLAVVLVDVLLTIALTGVAAVYVGAGLPAAWVVNTAVAAGAALVVTPFVGGVAVLLYLDLRVRAEGLDIELAAEQRFPR